AVAVQHDHRMSAAVERVHTILLVDADRRHIRVELPPRRQLGPVVDDLVAMIARSQNDRHRASCPFAGVASPASIAAPGESGAHHRAPITASGGGTPRALTPTRRSYSTFSVYVTSVSNPMGTNLPPK